MSHKLVSLYIGDGEYYTRTDADNVIAEKDKEIARLDDLAHAHNIELLRKENLIADKDKEIQRLENLCESYRIDCDNLAIREANAYKEIGRDNKKIIHQKHNRCLAMARICYMKSWSCLQYFTPREKYDHWKKWQKRWTELANKFKEAK